MSYLIDVTLIDVTTGEEEKLFVRKERRCHFKKPIYYKNYEINLRLDWEDCGYVSKKEPILDADIKDINTGKMLSKGAPWHHTRKEYDQKAGMETYNFRFQDLEIQLALKRTMGIKFTADAVLVNEE